MKILVLGHEGMLGSAVRRYFEEKNEKVITIEGRVSLENKENFLKKINEIKPDIIINCLGQIKQKYFEKELMYFINAEIPKRISSSISRDQILVQPSTDCIFSGNKGFYKLSDVPDPIDEYGKSKLESEKVLLDRSLVIRTSIVGLEKKTNYSLLSWFLSQKGQVAGYTNHFWSGLTTLEWCKSVDFLLSKNEKGIKHLSSLRISKFELLNKFRNNFFNEVEIIPVIHQSNIDRSLLDNSNYSIPDIEFQLKELKQL